MPKSKYNPRLYYSEKTEGSRFSHSPPGALSVPRLLKSQACWQVPGSAVTERKKTLVLTDWSARSWSFPVTDSDQVRKLQSLLDDGFDIFAWRNGSMERVSSVAEVCKIGYRSDISYATLDEVAKVAVQHGISHDEICLLDDYMLENLHARPNDMMPPRRIDQHHYERFKPGKSLKERQRFIHAQLNAVPPLSEFRVTRFDERIPTEATIQKEFPGVEVVYALDTFIVSSRSMGAMRAGLFDTLPEMFKGDIKYIDVASDAFEFWRILEWSKDVDKINRLRIASRLVDEYEDKDELGSVLSVVEKIEIAGDMDLDAADDQAPLIKMSKLQRLLSRMTAIQSLRIEGAVIKDGDSVALSPLPSLTRLELPNVKLSGTLLSAMLNAAPNLTELNINYVTGKDGIDLVPGSLPRLEGLSFDGLYNEFMGPIMSSSNLLNILAAAPNLKKLDLGYLNCLHGNMDFSNIDLSQVEELNLCDSNISAENLVKLLAVMPNLKVLNLSDCKNLKHPPSSDIKFNLPELEVVHLSSSEVNFDIVTGLFKASPKLRHANLMSMKLSAGTENKDDPVGQLLADYGNLNDEMMIDLSNHAKSLHSLSICIDEMVLDVSTLVDFSMIKSLTECRLKQASKDSNRPSRSMVLASLLAFSPNLEKLTLEDASLTEMPGNSLKRAFDNLKHAKLNNVIFHRCEMDPVVLGLFLKSATATEELTFQDCRFTRNGMVDLSGVKLDKLKNIYIQNCDMDVRMLADILRASPNIQRVRYRGKVFTLPEGDKPVEIERMIARITQWKQEGGHLRGTPRDQGSPSPRPIRPSYSLSDPAPQHDPKDMMDFTPTDKKEKFVYREEMTTFSQAMIINQLSQFLKINGICNDEFINGLQDGICNGLSNLFLSKNKADWDAMIKRLYAWDGKRETQAEVVSDLLEIHQFVEGFQNKQSERHQDFVGNTLDIFLANNPGGHVLTSGWHAIAVKYDDDNKTWLLYDPNCSGGYSSYEDVNALSKAVYQQIGNLVAVEAAPKDELKITPRLSILPDQFIKEGGLTRLLSLRDPDPLIGTLIPYVHALSKDAIESILLRDTDGQPAWLRALNCSHNKDLVVLTNMLIQQFIKLNPDDFQFKLQHSLEGMSNQSNTKAYKQAVKRIKAFAKQTIVESNAELKHSGAVGVVAASSNEVDQSNTNSPSVPVIIVDDDAIELPGVAASDHPNLDIYAITRELRTWESGQQPLRDEKEYYQHILAQSDAKKSLIEFASSGEAYSVALQIERYAASVKRPVFFINSPDDLICQASYIKRDGDAGTLCKGPGGPLCDFLTQEHKDGVSPVLIVNYDNFEADDIVKFNSLLDDVRMIDGVAVPEEVKVVGVMNTAKPGCYQGSDFYSRFDSREECPSSVCEQASLQRHLVVEVAESESQAKVIQLYGDANWQERLLGTWVVDGDTLKFEEGELVKALKKDKPVVLANADWSDRSFIQFWQQALSRGAIDVEGVTIKLPDSFTITHSAGYKVEHLNAIDISADSRVGLAAKSHINLSPSSLTDCFVRYRCDGDKLKTIDGLLKENENNSIVVNVTRDLTDAQWARFFDECNQFKVSPHLCLAPGVELPKLYTDKVKVEEHNDVDLIESTVSDYTGPAKAASQVIVSTDADVTAAQFKNYIVLDVSELTSSDLIKSLKGDVSSSGERFEFEEKVGFLQAALSRGDNVVLKGDISPELSDALANLMLERESQEKTKGHLVCIVDDAVAFSAFPVNEHRVSNDEKKQFLTDNGFRENEIDALGDVSQQAVCQLRAKLVHSRAGYADDVSPWHGMKSLPSAIHVKPFVAADAKKSYLQAQYFSKKRKRQVNHVLASSPFVFLAGITGVGKTTFVEKTLVDAGSSLFREGDIASWAKATGSDRKILFIDEANIGSHQWSQFEGLFNKPPSILLNGEMITLSDNHKIVFAANPSSYSNDRIDPSFLERHGGAVIFDPLPTAFLYHNIIKPAFEDSDVAPAVCAEKFLAVYQFMCEHAKDEVVISPRELQMMAMLTRSYLEQQPDADLQQVAAHYARLVAEPLVKASLVPNFDAAFPRGDPLPPVAKKEKQKADFLTTPSRVAVTNQLDDLMRLRELRQAGGNDVQRYGGLGGIVIEGEPGIGKSQLVRDVLLEHDIEPVIIPVGMMLEEKKELLMKAFNNGDVVIIDEINSSPMMERLLNDLLMGKGPDGQRPEKPGFMVIGTQNPITMAGRRSMSQALARRMLMTTLPPYTKDEMKEILVHKGLDSAKAEKMVEIYLQQREIAMTESRHPIPCFRDLLKVAKPHIVVEENRLQHQARQDVAVVVEPAKQQPAKAEREEKEESAVMTSKADKVEVKATPNFNCSAIRRVIEESIRELAEPKRFGKFQSGVQTKIGEVDCYLPKEVNQLYLEVKQDKPDQKRVAALLANLEEAGGKLKANQADRKEVYQSICTAAGEPPRVARKHLFGGK